MAGGLPTLARGTYISQGGTYLGWGGYLPLPGEGVHTLAGGYLCEGDTYLGLGGTYLGWGGYLPLPGEGVPTLAGGYLLWLGGTFARGVPTLAERYLPLPGGTYLDHGDSYLGWGSLPRLGRYLPWPEGPTLAWMGYPRPQV